MTRYLPFATVIILMLTALPAASQEPMTTRQAVETLEEYFDLLASGNLVSAEGLWTREAIERSSRFGITYSNIPLKVDATSPIVRNLDVMRDYLFAGVSAVNILEGGNFVRLDYKKVVQGKEVAHPYYAHFDGSYFWLTYPQDYVARDWPIQETKYFRIHYEPGTESFLHPVLLEQGDRFVDRIADSLSLESETLALIAEKKIEYFFCKSDSTVYDITGHFVKGTTDLASNDIITSFFPHNHEVAHLLLNLKLKSLPLYTQPILREGAAVHYGGRWGKAPTSLVFLGAFLHENKIVEVDSIITMERFENQAGADMAYPVAGLFTSFLLKEMGQKAYLELYMNLSGNYDELLFMNALEVKRRIYEAAKAKSWDQLTEKFTAYCRGLQSDGAVFAPGALAKKRGGFEDAGLQVRQDKNWISLTFNGGDSPGAPTGNLLFGYDQRLEGVRSILFEEQYQGTIPFPGYRWGIRFDGNEAGLYDYATNQLIGKYIFGITPSDDYHGADGKAVQVKYLIDLADGAVPTEQDHRLLGN